MATLTSLGKTIWTRRWGASRVQLTTENGSFIWTRDDISHLQLVDRKVAPNLYRLVWYCSILGDKGDFIVMDDVTTCYNYNGAMINTSSYGVGGYNIRLNTSKKYMPHQSLLVGDLWFKLVDGCIVTQPLREVAVTEIREFDTMIGLYVA